MNDAWAAGFRRPCGNIHLKLTSVSGRNQGGVAMGANIPEKLLKLIAVLYSGNSKVDKPSAPFYSSNQAYKGSAP